MAAPTTGLESFLMYCRIDRAEWCDLDVNGFVN